MKPKLSREASQIFKRVAEEWDIREGAGLFLPETELMAFDQLRAAHAALSAEGIYIDDRIKQRRLHPAAQQEREARPHLLQAFKQLNLDLDSLTKWPCQRKEKRPVRFTGRVCRPAMTRSKC